MQAIWTGGAKPRVSPAERNRILKEYSGTSVVYSSDNLQRDIGVIARHGFLILGESGFEGGGSVTDAQLKTQAKKVGADAVLYFNEFKGSEQSYVTLIQYHPG